MFVLFFIILLIVGVAAFSFNSNIFTKRSELRVTLEHPFLLDGKWVKASELKVGDELFTINGKKAEITNITKVKTKEPFLVYNLEAGELENFVLADGIIVHNSNRLEDFEKVGKDCVAGSCSVDVIYPDKTVKRMSLTKFNEIYQNNPYLRIIGSDGEALKLEDIILTRNLETETNIVKFRAGENDIKLTADHEIQLVDGRFISANNLRNGMMLKSEYGPLKVEEFTSYSAKGIKVYELKVDSAYSLTGDGPILRNPMKSTEGGIVLEPTISAPNLAQDILNKRRVVTKSRELNRIASDMGLTLEPGKGHLIVKDSLGNKITEIPQHPDINSNTAKSILKALAAGKFIP